MGTDRLRGARLVALVVAAAITLLVLGIGLQPRQSTLTDEQRARVEKFLDGR